MLTFFTPFIYSADLYLNSHEGLGPAPDPRLYTWNSKNFILAKQKAVIDSLNLRPFDLFFMFHRIYKETLKKKRDGSTYAFIHVRRQQVGHHSDKYIIN